MKSYPITNLKKINLERRNPKKFLILLFLILGIVAATQLVVTNLLAARGQELSELEKQVTTLVRENSALSEELSFRTSLNNIAEDAGKLGLVEGTSVNYINLNQDFTALAQ